MKTLATNVGSLVGSVVMGAVLAFPAYYTKLRWLVNLSETAALASALSAVALLVVLTHVIAARVSVTRVRGLMGRSICTRNVQG
ncbi:MAG: hypothetical protein BWY85_01396 [Firmicutes bacterium ADurb.Bin506]|nr:MAG: hypothetical protein BWY85_01396 [Firmicutes bacterium ADurb.Bin506]